MKKKRAQCSRSLRQEDTKTREPVVVSVLELIRWAKTTNCGLLGLPVLLAAQEWTGEFSPGSWWYWSRGAIWIRAPRSAVPSQTRALETSDGRTSGEVILEELLKRGFLETVKNCHSPKGSCLGEVTREDCTDVGVSSPNRNHHCKIEPDASHAVSSEAVG